MKDAGLPTLFSVNLPQSIPRKNNLAQPWIFVQTPINNIIVLYIIYYDIIVSYLFFEYIAGFAKQSII